METNTYQELVAWLHGRHYGLIVDGHQLHLTRQGKVRAIVTPPDRYQVQDVDLTFNEWVEFNKCLRNIRHYLLASGQAK